MYIFFTLAKTGVGTTSTLNQWQTANVYAATTQVNGVAITGDIFRITGVVVLPGIEAPSAARSSLIMRPYDQELVTCKRYYEKLTGSVGTGHATSAGAAYIVQQYIQKRAAPTTISHANLTGFNLVNASGSLLGVTTYVGPVIGISTANHIGLYNVASGLVAGSGTEMLSAPDSGYVIVDARL